MGAKNRRITIQNRDSEIEGTILWAFSKAPGVVSVRMVAQLLGTEEFRVAKVWGRLYTAGKIDKKRIRQRKGGKFLGGEPTGKAGNKTGAKLFHSTRTVRTVAL